MKLGRINWGPLVRVGRGFCLLDCGPYFSATERIARLWPDFRQYDRCSLRRCVSRLLAPNIYFSRFVFAARFVVSADLLVRVLFERDRGDGPVIIVFDFGNDLE